MGAASTVRNKPITIAFSDSTGQGGRLQEEWGLVYPPLRAKVLALADYTSRTMGKHTLTVTCLSRTKAENAAEDGNPRSLHMALPIRAVDLRVWPYRPHHIRELEKYWVEELCAGEPRFQFVDESHTDKPHIHVEAER